MKKELQIKWEKFLSEYPQINVEKMRDQVLEMNPERIQSPESPESIMDFLVNRMEEWQDGFGFEEEEIDEILFQVRKEFNIQVL